MKKLIWHHEDFRAERDIQTLKLLCDDHIFTAPLGQGTLVGHEKLVIDEFNLLIKQLDYDKNAFHVWLQKISTAKGAQAWRQQDTTG